MSISPSVDAERGTVEVKLEVPEPPEYLRPDMTVSVDIEVARRPDVIALPLEVLRDGATNKPWVLLLQDNRAVRRDVTIGSRTSDQVEIRDGLAPGEQVIVPEGTAIEPGARVRLKPSGG
jgi:HlyD family secretion protein